MLSTLRFEYQAQSTRNNLTGENEWDNLKGVIHKLCKFEEVMQVHTDTGTNGTIWEAY